MNPLKKAFCIVLFLTSIATLPAFGQPQGISHLTALSTPVSGRIDLAWTVPDPNDGTSAPSAYLVKYATSDINESDLYASWVSTFTQAWTALAATGADETRMVTGLTTGVTYYFAVVAIDSTAACGPWQSSLDTGGLANTANNAFAADRAPAAITVLTATPAWRRLTLAWTSPGDDGFSGALTGAYEIRVSTIAAIALESDWDAVPAGLGYPYQVVIATTAAANSVQSHVLTGLVNGATYYIAIKTTDGSGNRSALSTVSPKGVPLNQAPAAFSLSGPADNSVSYTGLPAFSWTASSDTDTALGDEWSYSLMISTDSGFANPTIISTTAVSSTRDLGSYEDKMLYWAVAAVDTEGAATVASPSFYRIQINTANVAPGDFNLLSPQTSSITATTTPALSWAASIDPDPGDTVTYRVDYSLAADFAGAVSSAGIAGTNYTLPALTENTTYWWRVWADDGIETKLCAAPFVLRVNASAEPPLAFGLTSPADDLVSSTSTIAFAWQATTVPDVIDALTYTVVWSTSPVFASSAAVAGLAALTTSYAGFAENGAYYWKVNAVGANGTLRSSNETRQFSVDCVKELPGSFSLLSPGSGVTISTTVTPTFSWGAAADPDPADVVRYTVDLSSRPDFAGSGTLSADRGSDLYYVPDTSLTDQTTYYWRVRATGYQGSPVPVPVDPGFTYSSTGTFSIWLTNHPPQAFALLSPAQAASVTTALPQLTWAAAADSDANATVSYTVTLSSSADFSGVLETAAGITETRYTVAAALPENRVYYWKVTATDNKGASVACQASFTFTVPVLNLPQAPAGVQGTLSADRLQFTIQWSGVIKNSDNSDITDLAGYRIYRGLSAAILNYYASVGPGETQWVDEHTDGGNLYYRVSAVDASGNESVLYDSPVINSLSNGALSMISDDGSLSVQIPAAVARAMLARNNTFGKDLRMQLVHDLSGESGSTILCYRLAIVSQDGAAVSGMPFATPIRMVFYYGAGTSAGRRLAAERAPGAGTGTMNVFWHNGIEYLRLGGAVSDSDHTVTLMATRGGEYQVRLVTRPAGFAVNSMNPKKVFTPGVEPYKQMTWFIDNPDMDKVTGQVFDLRGGFVAPLSPVGEATAETVILEWTGLTDEAKPAPKGVYIYQIKGSGKVINGTVIVVR